MKILIAYDGSSFADAAIDDLQWAGLPEEADAIVLSAVEWPLHAPRTWGMVETGYEKELRQCIKAAERLAQNGREHLQSYFPKWKIHAAASPAAHASTAILDKAKEWGADLIVAGTHGRSALSRVFLGSVSLNLVHEAPCSVRIARARTHDLPLRLLIADDGSARAEAAVAEVCRRHWPQGTEARVLAVHELLVTAGAENMAAAPDLYDRINEEEHLRLKGVIRSAAEKFDHAGIKVFPVLEEGDPKQALLREARNWNASAIFMGARGLGGFDRLLLGSVSSATVAHAPCSVEIVRAT